MSFGMRSVDGAFDPGVYRVELKRESTGDSWFATVSLRRDADIDSVESSVIRFAVVGLESESELAVPVTVVPAVVIGEHPSD